MTTWLTTKEAIQLSKLDFTPQLFIKKFKQLIKTKRWPNGLRWSKDDLIFQLRLK